jgi:hypothetical protein
MEAPTKLVATVSGHKNASGVQPKLNPRDKRREEKEISRL